MGQKEAEPASHESQCCGQDGFWSWAAPPALSSPAEVGPAPRALWLLNVTSHTQWSQRWLEQHLCGLVGRDQGPVGASWGSGRLHRGGNKRALSRTAWLSVPWDTLSWSEASGVREHTSSGTLLGMANWQDLGALWGLGLWASALCDLGAEGGRPARQQVFFRSV